MKNRIYLSLLLFLSLLYISAAQCGDYTGVQAVNVNPEICGVCGSLQYEILTTSGVANDFYTTTVVTGGGLEGFTSWDDGTGIASFCFEAGSCEPEPTEIYITVFCEDGGFLEEVLLATITVYPVLSVLIDNPGCESGELGSATLTNGMTSINCDLVQGVIGNSEDCNNLIPSTLSYSFVVFEGTSCERTFAQDIEVPCTGDCCVTDNGTLSIAGKSPGN